MTLGSLSDVTKKSLLPAVLSKTGAKGISSSKTYKALQLMDSNLASRQTTLDKAMNFEIYNWATSNKLKLMASGLTIAQFLEVEAALKNAVKPVIIDLARSGGVSSDLLEYGLPGVSGLDQGGSRLLWWAFLRSYTAMKTLGFQYMYGAGSWDTALKAHESLQQAVDTRNQVLEEQKLSRTEAFFQEAGKEIEEKTKGLSLGLNLLPLVGIGVGAYILIQRFGKK
jgi:hypothetical protein